MNEENNTKIQRCLTTKIWTDETVITAAKQCGSATEFKNKFPGAYCYAHKKNKNMWRTFTWFKHNTDPNVATYVIYVYEDKINKSAYIGLTNNIERRIKEHRKKNYKNKIRKYDIVRQYFEDNKLLLPDPIIKCSGINGYEAQELEEYYKKKYEKDGWYIINTGKTGKGTSSLGNLAYTPLTKEECANVAKTCKTRKEIRNKAYRVYAAIKRNGWEDLFPPKQGGRGFHRDKNYYKERVNNFSDRNNLMRKNKHLYEKIKNYGWLDEFFPPRYNNLCDEDILNLIEKYNSISDLRLNNYELYEYSKYKFILSDVFKLKKNKYVSKEKQGKQYQNDLIKSICDEYNNTSKGQKAIGKKHNMSPKTIKKILLNNGVKIKRGCINEWTIENAILYAKKFKSRTELDKNSNSCYRFLKKNNLLDEIFGHPYDYYRKNYDIYNPITTEECLKRCIKYKTWTRFAAKQKRCAKFCRNNDIVNLIKEEIQKHNPNYKIPKPIIDKDIQKQNCLNKALLCKTKLEFRTKYKQEYYFARVNKLLKTYTWLKGCKGNKDNEKKAKALCAAKKCSTKREFRENFPSEYRLAAKYKMLQDFNWFKGNKQKTSES